MAPASRKSCRTSPTGFTFGKGVIYYLRTEARDWTSLRRYSIATGAEVELSRIPGGGAATSCWSTASASPAGVYSSQS